MHPFQTDDTRLKPIYEKVLQGGRLDAADGLVLYGTGDILAVGWMANYVRERMHGDKTYFNVNRHLNPTNVCVAACRLCAFGRKKDTPGAYTMALEEAYQTAASGYSEAVTEFHIVGGLHPDLPFEYFLDLISGLKERFPSVHLKAFTMVEVAYLAKRAKLSIKETLEKMKGAGVDSLPGGGAEIFADRVRHIICDHKIDGSQWLDTANWRLPDLHSAGFSSGQYCAPAPAENHMHVGYQANCRQPLSARQLPAYQVLLADDDGKNSANFSALRRRRYGRHRNRRKNLPRCRRDNPSRYAPSGIGALNRRSWQGTDRTRYVVQASHTHGDFSDCSCLTNHENCSFHHIQNSSTLSSYIVGSSQSEELPPQDGKFY